MHKFRRNYNFYIFDLSKQKDQKASQPIRLEFKFNAAFGVADFIAYALILTPKLISISSDGQRHFDLLYFIIKKMKRAASRSFAQLHAKIIKCLL